MEERFEYKIEEKLNKIKRQKETWDLFLRNNGDESVFKYIMGKYNIKRSTVKGYLSSYKSNVVNPKPTLEELHKYEEILRNQRKNKNLAKPKINTSAKHDEEINYEIINSLIKCNVTEQLIKYAVESPYSVDEIIASTYAALSSNDKALLFYERKLLNITKALLENKEYINNEKTKESRTKDEITFNNHFLDEVREIIKKTITLGSDSFEYNLTKSRITPEIFKEYINFLNDDNQADKKLYKYYLSEIENTPLSLKEKFFAVLYYIKSGVEKTGGHTYFNLFDYFSIIKLELVDIIKLAMEYRDGKLITNEDLELIKSFVNYYYPSLNVLTVNEIYEIEDLLSIEEKNMIIDQIKRGLGVDLYEGLYQQMASEYTIEQLYSKAREI